MKKTFATLLLCFLPWVVAGCVTDKGTNFLGVSNKADIAYMKGDFTSAEKGYTLLVKKKVAPFETKFKLANIYARSNRVKEAITLYEEVLEAKPDFAPAWRNLGVVRLRQAMALLLESQRRLPEDDELYRSNQKIIAELSKMPVLGGNNSSSQKMP